MKIAIFGDLHSNHFAFRTFKDELEKYPVEHCIITGDIFGYYPWALETFNLLQELELPFTCIKGNHDQMILDKISDPKLTIDVSYWPAIEQNLRELNSQAPEAIEWLNKLESSATFKSDYYAYSIYHGTPDDPLKERFYPDNVTVYTWFPSTGEVIISGHTHYPLLIKTQGGGLVLNPGSIGQPRDGSVQPSWILFDDEVGEASLLRFSYPVEEAVLTLTEMHWDERAIKALQKTDKGKLLI